MWQASRAKGVTASQQGPGAGALERNALPGGAGPAQFTLKRSGRVMAEELAYKEYRIVPMPRGWGWQALIYAPGSNRHLPESPSTRDPVGRTSVMDTARLVVDRLLHSS